MKITDNVELIDGTLANCYVVTYGGKSVLIDAGMRSSAKKIISYFNQKGTKPDSVLITHYHMDHIGGLSDVVGAFSSDVYADDREISVLKGESKVKSTGSLMSKMVSGAIKTRPIEMVKPTGEVPYDWIKVVSTTGHTPGSTSYLFVPDNVLFVGDAVTEKNGELSINRQFSLDMPQAEKSKNLITSMSGVTILPGHGKPLKIQ